MKFISRFNFFKKQRELPSEILYQKINSSDRYSFRENHIKSNDYTEEYNNLKIFLGKKSEYVINKKYKDGYVNNKKSDFYKYAFIVDDVEKYGIVISKITSAGFFQSHFAIEKFEDEWYIIEFVKFFGLDVKKIIFKCDTLDGIKQILLKYKE